MVENRRSGDRPLLVLLDEWHVQIWVHPELSAHMVAELRGAVGSELDSVAARLRSRLQSGSPLLEVAVVR